MALLALGGRPQPLKKPSQCQKGHFYDKIIVINDNKTPELAKSAITGNICVHLCDLSTKVFKNIKMFKWHNGPKKPQTLNKNKACTIQVSTRCWNTGSTPLEIWCSAVQGLAERFEAPQDQRGKFWLWVTSIVSTTSSKRLTPPSGRWKILNLT